jgi:hypothetical protein
MGTSPSPHQLGRAPLGLHGRRRPCTCTRPGGASHRGHAALEALAPRSPSWPLQLSNKRPSASWSSVYRSQRATEIKWRNVLDHAENDGQRRWLRMHAHEQLRRWTWSICWKKRFALRENRIFDRAAYAEMVGCGARETTMHDLTWDPTMSCRAHTDRSSRTCSQEKCGNAEGRMRSCVERRRNIINGSCNELLEWVKGN